MSNTVEVKTRVKDKGQAAGLFFLRTQPTLAIAGGVLIAMFAIAFLGPQFWTASSTSVSLGESLLAPSAEHPMGTDDLGRDMLARFLAGAQLSMMLGLAVTVVGAVLGGALGVFAGMANRRLDGALTWVINTVLAFPPLMLAMAVSVALGADLISGSIGLVIASIPWFARVLRSEAIRIRSLPSVEAAIVSGASQMKLVKRYVLPHLVPTMAIQAAAAFGWAILTLAALGFVGLGAQPPTAEWGSMITGGLQYSLSGQWWIGVFPGLGLVVVVVAASILADRTRDLLDPRGAYARI